MKASRLALPLAFGLALIPCAALAADAVPDVEAGKLGSVLMVFLVLSLVFETAMTPIFNWRIFLRHFEGKGVKIPLTIVLAFLIFWSYELDIVEMLLAALGHQKSSSVGGQVLTALLIAGGSDGIFRIFVKLGIRDPEDRKKKAEQEQSMKRSREGK